jgi:hypothetical protein
MDVVEDQETNLPTTETSGVESRQCIEALTQPIFGDGHGRGRSGIPTPHDNRELW